MFNLNYVSHFTNAFWKMQTIIFYNDHLSRAYLFDFYLKQKERLERYWNGLIHFRAKSGVDWVIPLINTGRAPVVLLTFFFSSKILSKKATFNAMFSIANIFGVSCLNQWVFFYLPIPRPPLPSWNTLSEGCKSARNINKLVTADQIWCYSAAFPDPFCWPCVFCWNGIYACSQILGYEI